jgi:hypothetical protein
MYTGEFILKIGAEVWLDKCEKQFSATTIHHDYALSPTLFHWQTQNSAKSNSGRGLGYIKRKENNKLKMNTGKRWDLLTLDL